MGWVNCYGVLCASVKFGTGTRCMRAGGTYLDDRQLEHQSAVFTQKRQFSVLLSRGVFEEYEEGGRDRRGQRVEREDENGERTERGPSTGPFSSWASIQSYLRARQKFRGSGNAAARIRGPAELSSLVHLLPQRPPLPSKCPSPPLSPSSGQQKAAGCQQSRGTTSSLAGARPTPCYQCA